MSDRPSAVAGQLARRSMVDRERVAADEVRRLLDAGLEVLATSPAARVGDIVRVSGLSNSAFYRYFASKDELIAAILRDGSERLTAYLEHQMAKVDEPVEQVEAWITGVLDQARNERLAAPTRALLVQSRRLGGGGQGETMAGAADALRAPLLAPLAAMGRPDPERDAVLVAEGVVALLLRELEAEGPVLDGTIEHARAFYRAALSA
jgi:AcrR family transcriptional regulator